MSKLTAEQIVEAAEDRSGTVNRQAIEDMFEAQTQQEVWCRALRRADHWPYGEDRELKRQGLQYAYLLEFLITQEGHREGEQ